MRPYIWLAFALQSPGVVLPSSPTETRLVSALANNEAVPETESGEVIFTSKPGLLPDNFDPPEPTQHVEYRYRIDGPSYVVLVTNVGAADQTLPTVYCNNDRYSFLAHKWPSAWSLSDVRPRSATVGLAQTRWATFAAHFSVTHSIHGKPLSQLIASSEFVVAIRPESARVYHVNGVRREADTDGLQGLTATVQFAESGRKAYIKQSTAIVVTTDKKGEGKWRTEIGIENDVRDGMTGPILVASKDSRREQHGDEVRLWENHTAFTSRTVLTEDERREFYLSYYGLPEPTFDDNSARPANPRRNYALLLLLPLLGILLIVVGRRLPRPVPGRERLPGTGTPAEGDE